MQSNIPSVRTRAPDGTDAPNSTEARGSRFSLVELVVVVTLVGFMASFAIPRFTRLENQARTADVVALSVRVRDAAQAAHAQYAASGAAASTANWQGKTVTLRNGYPDLSASGMRLGVASSPDFVTSSTPTSMTYSKAGAPVPDECAVTYVIPSSRQDAAAITSVKTAGC